MTRLLAVLLAGLVSGCAPVPDDAITAEALRDAVMTRYIEPYRAGDTERWMAVFADDVVALHDGMPPLEGKDQVRGFAEAVAANFQIRQLDVTLDEVRIRGDWAWTRGRFQANFQARSEAAPPGVAGPRAGKFLLVWERRTGADEAPVWQVILDMGNSL